MSTWESEMAIAETRLAKPKEIPCMSWTVRTIDKQLARCPSVRGAWISTIQESEGEPKLCVAIEVDSTVSNPQEILRSIVDPLMAIAEEIGPPDGIRYSKHSLRDVLTGFIYFVTNEGQQAQLSAVAGIAIYPLSPSTPDPERR
jgi:hypothetical protein